jgi:hypothetical protein
VDVGGGGLAGGPSAQWRTDSMMVGPGGPVRTTVLRTAISSMGRI